jgi:vitamin B12 transporter
MYRVRVCVAAFLAACLAATFSAPAFAQVSVSPTLELPAITVVTPQTNPKPNLIKPKSSNATSQGSGTMPTKPKVAVSPTSVPTPTDQVASSVSVITAHDIEVMQRRTGPDALRDVPGINVVQTGGPGGLTSVFMRGTNANHTKVLIDGIDVSDPSNANRSYDLGQLLTNDIAQMEVLRGPQSGLYGADALGGVIVITTQEGSGPPKITGTIEGGSFGTFNQYASANGSEDHFRYAINAGHFRSTDTPVTPLDLLATGEARLNDSYDNQTYTTKFGVDITPFLTVNTVARYTDATLKFMGDNFANFPAVFPDDTHSIQMVHQFYTRGETVLSLLGGAFKNYFAVGYTNDWNSNFSPDVLPNVSINQGQRIKYDWRGVATLAPGQILVVGLEDQTERLEAPDTTAEESNRAAYAEFQSKVAKTFFLAANIRVDDNEDFGSHTTWRVAPGAVLPWTDTEIKGSAGTAFKAPSLSQRFIDLPAFLFFANRNLLPEQSFGYDYGFEQPVFDNRFRFGATYFHNNITNLIEFTPFDPVTFISSNANIGRATTRGVESFASLAITRQFGVRADYTRTIAIDDDTGLELLRRPKNKASLTATYAPADPWTLSATLLRVGDWLDFDRFGTRTLTAPGYTVVNLAGSYKVTDNASLFGRIDNAFDRHYEDPTGFLRPGIGFFAGVKLNN